MVSNYKIIQIIKKKLKLQVVQDDAIMIGITCELMLITNYIFLKFGELFHGKIKKKHIMILLTIKVVYMANTQVMKKIV
jgi:hypothetical protein